MRIGMIGIVNNLSTKLSSHNAGWTFVTKSILENKFNNIVEILDNRCDYNLYDVLIINEGVNYKEGVFNFFGGVQPRQIDSLVKLSFFKGKLYCVNQQVDYNALIKKRKELKNLDITFTIPEVIDLSKLNNKLILGDSHSISIYKPGYGISRNDGKTLHSFLNTGLHNFIDDDCKELIFYAGNIDVRFHLKRFKGEETIFELVNELKNQLLELKNKGIKVTLTHLLPIEDESRKIPGTGQYKGNNFNGSKEERTKYVLLFNECIYEIASELGLKVITWDFDYNKGLQFEAMESKQSVHLRPEYYKFINEIL
jgi:hypothetical protein